MVKVIPKIPKIIKGKFSEGYVNDVHGWAFSKEKVKETNLDGTPKLLTLDIDFGLQCSLNCPHCFRRSVKLDDLKKNAMTYEETINILKQAKELGLESIKFLGAGEPFENKQFLDFLIDLKKLEITPCIFTKGHVIGDDKLVKRYYGHHGITTGKQLAKKLRELDVSILLGFNSFDTKIQNSMVAKDGICGVKNYTPKRNKALKLFVDAGFNKTNPTRLALIAAPITPKNIKDIFEIYKWGRERNLYVVSTPTMVSGRGKEQQQAQNLSYGKEKFEEDLIQLYTKINIWNIKKGITTLSKLKEEGVSAYAGCHPCNQASSGMYITLKGLVIRCPGRDDEQSTFCEDIRKSNLKKVWQSSENYKRAGTFNNKCPAKDGKTIPSKLYREVLKNVIQYFQKPERDEGCNFEGNI
jgi:MoaA/NifB/PqqE/SkfB family radical SAM enzyme